MYYSLVLTIIRQSYRDNHDIPSAHAEQKLLFRLRFTPLDAGSGPNRIRSKTICRVFWYLQPSMLIYLKNIEHFLPGSWFDVVLDQRTLLKSQHEQRKTKKVSFYFLNLFYFCRDGKILHLK